MPPRWVISRRKLRCSARIAGDGQRYRTFRAASPEDGVSGREPHLSRSMRFPSVTASYAINSRSTQPSIAGADGNGPKGDRRDAVMRRRARTARQPRPAAPRRAGNRAAASRRAAFLLVTFLWPSKEKSLARGGETPHQKGTSMPNRIWHRESHMRVGIADLISSAFQGNPVK